MRAGCAQTQRKKVRWPWFFSLEQTSGRNKGFQIPITDEKLISDFSKKFSLTRTTEPGLSIVVPFPVEDITLEDMIASGISTYFFPILAGALILDFDGEVVNNDSLRDLAKT